MQCLLLSLLPLSAVAVLANADDVGNEVSDGASFLLQLAIDPATSTNWTETLMTQMEKKWTTGFWAKQVPFADQPNCGKSTFQELQVTIPLWKQRNPGVDGFCHFLNNAFWFYRAGEGPYYANAALHFGRKSMHEMLCDGTGELSTSRAPPQKFNYDGGSFEWTHPRNCIDIVDDPYCYSLGWLKGQASVDEALTKNETGWEEHARQECERLQEEFHFDDEEVTVGRHIFTTPLYLKRTLNSLRGRGTPISRRLHAEHVYTKCQLGGAKGAATEMSYCFYKACVLPGNKIGHFDECGYEAQ